jgi:type IV fimbrial biogenesis protein FimT
VNTPPKLKAARNMQGFTVLELMAVVLITAILTSLAVPAFNNTIRDNRVLAASNELVVAIALARSEAVRRAKSVTVCPSADGLACGTDWSLGWIVLEDGATVAGAAPVVTSVLTVNGAPRATLATQTAGANSWVRFTSRGIAEELVTLEIKPETCDSGTSFQELTISLVGRAAFTKKTC